MCVNDYEIKCVPRVCLTRRQKNLCNEKLHVNRDVICSILAASLSESEQPLKCLDGIAVCGTDGMLWEKRFGEQVIVTINGIYEEDYKVISKNVEDNGLSAEVVNEDPCVLLRKNAFDFIYLNCKTVASWYLDSVFSKIKERCVLVLTTSEDPSLYWQTSEKALRNYGGVITRTSYNREVSVRLVIAEMARAAARYHKGLKVECVIAYKPQQSFTIVARVKKGTAEANSCTENIKKLAHCILCEDRKFISNSFYLDKTRTEMNCNCSNESAGKVIVGIGPLWAGGIFNVEFIESVIKNLKGYPWRPRVLTLLNLILEEARCGGNSMQCPSDNTSTDSSHSTRSLQPYFYINTHRHSAKKFGLLKLSRIIRLLQKNGYCASRTHFDSEAIRTNASVVECVKILKDSIDNHREMNDEI